MPRSAPECRYLESVLVTELPPAVDGCEDGSWCFVDELGMIIPQVTGSTQIPPSPMLG